MLTLAVLTAGAQQRYACTHFEGNTRGSILSKPDPPVFERDKVYRQPVVLISFTDKDFSMDNPARYYDRLFNEEGFNEGVGPGCVADYLRDQSDGLVNMQFDIYGPYKVNSTAGGHGRNYHGFSEVGEAVELLNASVDTDFPIYDWDGDGIVNQVLFVFAGYTGNNVTGYIWPSTSWLGGQLSGDIEVGLASISCEKWGDDFLCGMGTIIHEFLHCMGVPDIYPLGGASYFSSVDEWDLMDGGNYTNHGWCPPNLTAMEKLFLGWDQPTELTEPTTITDLKSVSKGGGSYLIRNSGDPNEFYLLENRRQEGWDYGCPGNGLCIYHVDFNRDAWLENEVNITDSHFRFSIFHADRKDYLYWDPKNNGEDPTKWTLNDWMRNKYLSTSPYPYTDPETLIVNASLTDTSAPAAMLYNSNAEGLKKMSKPVTNIRMADDGTISFDFMKDETAIRSVLNEETQDVWYDLQGRRFQGPPIRKGIYLRDKKKIIRQ